MHGESYICAKEQRGAEHGGPELGRAEQRVGLAGEAEEGQCGVRCVGVACADAQCACGDSFYCGGAARGGRCTSY